MKNKIIKIFTELKINNKFSKQLIPTISINIILLFSLFMVITIIAFIFYFTNIGRTYEGCMLEQMKGQGNFSYHYAKKYCDRKFKIENLIPRDKIDLSWEMVSDGLRVYINKNESEYNITGADLTFLKLCKQSGSLDLQTKVVFKNQNALVKLSAVDTFSYISGCMKTNHIYGTYK